MYYTYITLKKSVRDNMHLKWQNVGKRKNKIYPKLYHPVIITET